MERVYQCVKCGLTFKTKRQIISHLVNTEKINKFVVDYYYQSFSVHPAELNKIV
jgi:hypothetical protein